MSHIIVTQKVLKEYLKYDPLTGVFVWRVSRGAKKKTGDEAGYVQPTGYKCIGLLGKRYLAHRLAFLYMEGVFPKDEVDHLDHNRADNRWANLRHADRATNARNRSLSKNNTSRTTGVYWYKRKWVAYIKVNGKRYHLGRSFDYQEAVARRKAAERKYGFHENHGK